MGALGFSLTLRAERVVAVSPAERTKQLKVISLCSHTHHQPLTNLLLAETQLSCGSRCCGRDNKRTRCRTDEIWQELGGGEPGEGKHLPASKGPGGGRVSLQGSKRELPPLLPKSDHLPTYIPIQDPPPTSSPQPLTIYLCLPEALCLTLLRPLAATPPLVAFTSNSGQYSTCPHCLHFCSSSALISTV